ncbi:hypothetical protein DID78_02715 [Candidatus Marinamargulisbacteria bacterium SCGC AG-343-D04]|nr:hypothetical protein DID78_02715 [Candidatus Marinamargulisbacteria bacterium SCGC AG-343-D04]
MIRSGPPVVERDMLINANSHSREKEAEQRIHFINKRFEKPKIKIFESLKSVEQDSDFKDSLDKAIDFNTSRISKRKSRKSLTRLTKRSQDLNDLRRFVNENKGIKFIGLIGWGKGCISTTLESGKDISAVDGFLYEDENGGRHYQRLGSCLECSIKFEGKSLKNKSLATLNGVDLDFSKKTVTLPDNTTKNIGDLFSKKILGSLSFIGDIKQPELNAQEINSIPEKETENTTFSIQEQRHGDHAHYVLGEGLEDTSKTSDNSCNFCNLDSDFNQRTDAETKDFITGLLQRYASTVMGSDEEGCPCCTAGLDFDEFAAAIKSIVANSNNEEESLVGMAHFDDPAHWGIFFGVAVPFAAIGLTAAYRNIKGSISTRKKLKIMIKGVTKDIEDVKKLSVTKTGSEKKEYETLLSNLIAFKETLKYSKMDAEFNLIVPGFINGAASSLVLSTGVFHHPFALPVIALYATGQLGRNVYDLARVWNRHIPGVEKTQESKEIKVFSYEDLVHSGKRCLNKIAKQQRMFYTANSTGFAVFAAGAILTFLSIPAMAVPGLGIATLIAGLCMLTTGAAVTGVLNNYGPAEYKPRNGDLGVSRLALDREKCQNHIGLRTELINKIKESRNKNMQKRSWGRFWAKFQTALPWGLKAGEKRLHKINKSRFKKGKVGLKNDRGSILSRFLEINGFKSRKIPNTLNDHWQVCKELGLEQPIINAIIKDEEDRRSEQRQLDRKKRKGGHTCTHHHHKGEHEEKGHKCTHHHHKGEHEEKGHKCTHHHHKGEHKEKGHACNHKHHKGKKVSHSCGGYHSSKEFTAMVKETGFFTVEDENHISMKKIQDLSKDNKKKFGEIIDEYIHFRLYEDLLYQQKGLAEYHWHLPQKKPNTT